MKKLLVLGIAFAALALTTTSCLKKKEISMTPDDAADAIAEMMEYKSGGFAESVEAAALYLEGQNLNGGGDNLDCGESFDSTITRTYNTASVQASYTHSWQYTLNCDGATPVSITGTGNHSGHYDGPRILSNTEGTRNWTITGLEGGSPNFIYNGTMDRGGVHTSKVRQKNTFTTSVDVVSSDVLVSKSTHKIVSGSATVAIHCTSSNGKEYDFSGSLVFNGDDTATLTLNGNPYMINF